MRLMRKMRLSLVAGVLFASIFGGMLGMTAVPAGQAAAACDDSVLGIPPWYKGLTEGSGSSCKIKGPDQTEAGLTQFIWKIALNVIEIVLRVIAYAAVGFIVYGGFQLIISNGNPDGMSRAIKTIINAAVGLAIALSAVAIKNFIWELMGVGSNDFGVSTMSLSFVIGKGLNMAYTIAGSLAVVMAVVGGLNYVLSNGDPQKAAKARRTITYAVIGVVVIMFAFVITTFINDRF